MKKLILLFTILLTSMSPAVAQEPTISEAFLFIKLKTINKEWYTTKLKSFTYAGCKSELKYSFSNLLSMNLIDNKIAIVGECFGEKTELLVNLELIQSIEVLNNKISLSSTTSFYEIMLNGNLIAPDNKFVIEIYLSKDTDDAERVKKAFNHLLKMLNIELVSSKF